MSVALPGVKKVVDDDEDGEDEGSTCKEEEPEEEEELQAVADHFGKDLSELTLEALLELEPDMRPVLVGGDLDPQKEGDVPERKAPSLASILGTMPTAATLGLNKSISDCMADEKENGERGLSSTRFIWFLQLRSLVEQSHLESHHQKFDSLFRGFVTDRRFLGRNNLCSWQERRRLFVLCRTL